MMNTNAPETASPTSDIDLCRRCPGLCSLAPDGLGMGDTGGHLREDTTHLQLTGRPAIY